MNSQQAAFEKLSRLKVGALFMEMGTGKTKVALDLIASKRHRIDYVLWICPCSLKGEIKDISNRMASTIRHNRARGTHSIELMTNIVAELVEA